MLKQRFQRGINEKGAKYQLPVKTGNLHLESEIHYVRFSRNQLGGESEKKEKRRDRDASGSHWLPLAQMLVLVARSYDQDWKS